MPRPRKSLVSVADTPYYHVMCRCVRRAYLCGEDRESGRSFEHRKGWIVERLKLLTEVFAIELAGYAVMSNHYHLVVRLAPERVHDWSETEVIERWRRVFSGPQIIAKYQAGETSPAEAAVAGEVVASWRERLGDLSWFMRCLNEPVARAANAEDGCSGRFWEGRFKSQALLDDAAVLTCMTYVDLNPIRAGIADSPETSAFTEKRGRTHSPGPSPFFFSDSYRDPVVYS